MTARSRHRFSKEYPTLSVLDLEHIRAIQDYCKEDEKILFIRDIREAYMEELNDLAIKLKLHENSIETFKARISLEIFNCLVIDAESKSVLDPDKSYKELNNQIIEKRNEKNALRIEETMSYYIGTINNIDVEEWHKFPTVEKAEEFYTQCLNNSKYKKAVRYY